MERGPLEGSLGLQPKLENVLNEVKVLFEFIGEGLLRERWELFH